ncbi:hypothetical protein FPJ27_14775 [Burkholderia sp. MS455]|uniref:hypothetical protein n=1 Tax=Burkholderia sp. MS455 TaxID=2811788 RepID=UPI00195D2ECF|nr:hypothetical protein [Burkholderia sp. MS455]QRR07561.1 hypothetical protein FPJ27_14775 [Burkholderia sp. MS455]
MKALDIEEICRRIGVQRPYFAFRELHDQGNSTVLGVFASEQSTGFERGSVASAEIGRHLAILGSCAAALAQSDQKIYYLATKARLTHLRDTPTRPQGEPFQAIAEVTRCDSRTMSAHAIVTDGKPFAHLHCEYQILPAPLFGRLFKRYRILSEATTDESPYKNPIPLEFGRVEGLLLKAYSPPLPQHQFAGHFQDYPTWPVAILADTVAQVRSRLLHHMLGEQRKYTIIRVDLEALQLVSALESLTFEVECVSQSTALSHYVFSGRVMHDQKVSATMEMEVLV